MHKIVVVTNRGPVHNVMFSDLKELENVVYIDEKVAISNKLIRMLNKIHESRKVNKIIQLPFKGIWQRTYNLNKVIIDKDEKYKVLFTDVTITDYPIPYLKKIASMKNVQLNILLINPIEKPDAFTGSIQAYLDAIRFEKKFTFDMRDAKQYGLEYTPCIYSKMETTPQNVEYDLLFIGKDKGRCSMLHSIFGKGKKEGCRSKFFISDKKEDVEFLDEITYNQEMEYKAVIDYVNKSNCLLEIVQNGQSGVTFRTYEAICYNKLLVTNNHGIEKFPLYNPNFMRIFDTIEDIDWDFIKTEMEVDYLYQGEFSPKHLISKL